MKVELWVTPEKAEAIQRKKGGDRFITDEETDQDRNGELEYPFDEFTISAYNGHGHSSHYFSTTYKVISIKDGVIRFRKKARRT